MNAASKHTYICIYLCVGDDATDLYLPSDGMTIAAKPSSFNVLRNAASTSGEPSFGAIFELVIGCNLWVGSRQ